MDTKNTPFGPNAYSMMPDHDPELCEYCDLRKAVCEIYPGDGPTACEKCVDSGECDEDTLEISHE